jgi:hypothetical protein
VEIAHLRHSILALGHLEDKQVGQTDRQTESQPDSWTDGQTVRRTAREPESQTTAQPESGNSRTAGQKDKLIIKVQFPSELSSIYPRKNRPFSS